MIVGIDPGLEGGIAAIAPNICHLFEMPLKGKDIDFNQFAHIMAALREKGIVHIYLERAIPFAMGTKHAFNYGRGFAALEIALELLNSPYTYVEPAKWTKSLFEGIDSKLKPKERGLIALQRLIPSEIVEKIPKSPRTGKYHSGVVDAVLIAEYGRLQQGK